MDEEKDFKNSLKDKRVPILVLDQKWHRLFALNGKTPEILRIEADLNKLVENLNTVNREDSLQRVAKMPPSERNTIIASIISVIQAEEAKKIALPPSPLATVTER